MIKNTQELQRISNRADISYSLAVIDSISTNGIKLKFPDGSVSQKEYLCNTSVQFETGQKVVVQKIGGNYVVCFPIGKPTIEGG